MNIKIKLLMLVSIIGLVNTAFAFKPTKKKLIIPINYIPTLNNIRGNEVESNKVFYNISHGLVELNENLKPRPNLATWKINYLNKCILFTLREMSFTDGSKLESIDVKRIIDKRINEGLIIARLIKKDSEYFKLYSDKKFEICLKNIQSVPVLINVLSSVEFFITKLDDSMNIIGTGNYKVSKVSRSKLTLISAKKSSKFSSIEFVVIKDKNTVTMLKDNLLNETYNINSKKNKIENNSMINKKQFNIGTLGIVLKTKSGCFHNQKNREILRDYVYNHPIGEIYDDVVTAQSLIPEGYFGHKLLPIVKSLKSLVLECSLNISLRDKYKGSIQVKYLTFILEGVNAKFKIKYTTFSEILEGMKNGNNIDLTFKIDLPSTSDPTQTFTSYKANSSQNITGYKNEVIDSQIRSYYLKSNLNDKLNVIQAIVQEIYNSSPVIPVQAYKVVRYNDFSNKKNIKDYRFWNFNYDNY